MKRARIKRTAASRRTLPTYPAFCVVVGAAWAFDPGSRLGSSAVLRYAGIVAPIMGLAVLVIGLVLAFALWGGWTKLYTRTLGALLGWMIVWTGVLLLAAAFGQATWGAFAWPFAFAAFCWASMISLEAGEGA